MSFRREEVAALLRQQARSLQVEILSDGPASTFELEIDGKRYYACALASSRDYYEYRFNLHASQLTALVVGEHNTCVPLPVLALDEGYWYAPAEAPRWYSCDAPRSRKNAMVIIGGLLTGVEEAYAQVKAMSRSTRYRYLAAMRAYLSPKQGRKVYV